MATALGANVTAVCSERNAELVRSLGAIYVVASTTTVFTETNRRLAISRLVAPEAASRAILDSPSVSAPGLGRR